MYDMFYPESEPEDSAEVEVEVKKEDGDEEMKDGDEEEVEAEEVVEDTGVGEVDGVVDAFRRDSGLGVEMAKGMGERVLKVGAALRWWCCANRADHVTVAGRPPLHGRCTVID